MFFVDNTIHIKSQKDLAALIHRLQNAMHCFNNEVKLNGQYHSL